MPEQQKPTATDILTRIKGTNGLKTLLKDSMVTTRIAGAEEAIEKVTQQLQRDISADKDLGAEEGWAIVKALQLVQDYTLMFAKIGNAILSDEQASRDAAKPSTQQ